MKSPPPKSPPPPWRALVVLAALGDDRRRWQVARQAIERHFDDAPRWGCMLLAYSARAVAANGSHERYLRRRCVVAVRERAFWGSLLNLTTPAVVAPYDHVLVLLDDVELSPSFDAAAFVNEARRYKLARASPSVVGATWASATGAFQSFGADAFRRTQHAITACGRAGGGGGGGGAGGHCSARLVPWVESFVTLYTRAAWGCYHSMFDDAVLRNDTAAIGYGYDRCFGLHCSSEGDGGGHRGDGDGDGGGRRRGRPPRQGILLGFVALHLGRNLPRLAREPRGERRLSSLSDHSEAAAAAPWVARAAAAQRAAAAARHQRAAPHGRRLSLVPLAAQADAQAAALEAWVVSRLRGGGGGGGGGGGPSGRHCASRVAAPSRHEDLFPVEHADGTHAATTRIGGAALKYSVSGGASRCNTCEACWYSCCCYNVSAAARMEWSAWTPKGAKHR